MLQINTHFWHDLSHILKYPALIRMWKHLKKSVFSSKFGNFEYRPSMGKSQWKHLCETY